MLTRRKNSELEEKSLSTVMILLGGSMFLLVGFVTLVAVIPATFVSLIPIRENVFQQSNLLPVEWLLPFIGFSVVLILMALLMFRCARSIYTHDAARTKTSASLAVVAS